MEDQQPRPGDLTGEPAGPTEPAEPPTEPAEPPGEPAEPPAEPAGGQPGRLLSAAAAASAALFVGAAAFAGAMAQPYLADRAVLETKADIVRTAVKAIGVLWNYTPETMDTLADRASLYLSGDLQVDYRKFIDTIAAANKQARVTDSTEITGAAVESLNGSEATVLMYTNTTATSELQKTVPSLKYQSHRLSMRRDHTRWVITRMPTVTSLNLTPQL